MTMSVSTRGWCVSTDGSRVVFLWTRDDLPILTLAVSSTLDHAAMFDWWLTAGPVH